MYLGTDTIAARDLGFSMAARQPAASASTSSIEKRTDSFFLFLMSASHMPGRLPVRGKHVIHGNLTAVSCKSAALWTRV